MPKFNTSILEFVNNAVGQYHVLDKLFLFVTSTFTLVTLGVCLLVYLGLYLPYKKKGTVWNDVFIVAVIAVTHFIVTLLKVLIAYPRPFQVLNNVRVMISLPMDYSFPSGHAALTMALATAVYLFNRRLGELLFALAFVVGLSRIYVGVHYPLDVGAGFLLGYAVAKILGHFFVKKESLKLQ